MKFAKGPWHGGAYAAGVGIPIDKKMDVFYIGGEQDICYISNVSVLHTHEELEHSMYLILNAPELYHALKNMILWSQKIKDFGHEQSIYEYKEMLKYIDGLPNKHILKGH